MELKDDPEVSSAPPLEGSQFGARPAIEANAAGVRLFEQGQKREKGRLARPGGPGDGDPLSGCNLEVDAVQGTDPAAGKAL